jgi:Zn-dependent alcohol dehydrogenase
MKAAVLSQPGQPLSVEDLSLQDPREGEIRVRVEAAGVCHTDLHYMNGDLVCPLPVVPGHEGAGIVEQVGAGVSRVRPGDRVILMWRPRCGYCEQCASGRPAQCVRGQIQRSTGGLLDGTRRLRRAAGPGGTAENVSHLLGVACFAEECVVPEQAVIPVSADTPARIAALVGCAVITGLGTVLNVVGNAAGRSVLVIGAGGVGLSSVIGAALVGAEPIVVADIAPEKLALARRLGATHTVDVSGDTSLVEAVLEICPGGVEWALEAVGRTQGVEEAVQCVRPGGSVVAIGVGKVGATIQVPLNELVQKDKRIIGSLYGSANSVLDIPRLLRLYHAGRLPLDDLLGGSYPLAAVNDAYDALVSGATGRAVILPNGGSDADGP